MTDATLERIWSSREAISRRCGYDARRLVRFYQSQRTGDASEEGTGAPRPGMRRRRQHAPGRSRKAAHG